MIPHALREALASFRRTPLLASLSSIMIGLSLFLVGLFGIVAHNIRVVLERIESRVQIVAYLHDDAAAPDVRIAQEQIGTFAGVKDVLYISRDQALRKALAELPEFRTVFVGLDANPLPASLEVTLLPNQSGPEAVKDVAEKITQYPFVEDVRYGSEWLDKVFLLRRAAGAATVVLGTAFAVVAALIIGAAVRMAIYARRDEIAIMRLVGATSGYIRRPFLVEGFLSGILGGIVALMLTRAAFDLLSGSLLQLTWLPETWVVFGLIGGCVLGVAASAIAVRRYLREV
jgi:cell division transport system permease protein